MPEISEQFDVAVVGSGHAGIEAALAAARIGCNTVMLTQNLDTIGQMSCNPAVGGSAKGHLVREIDALGGAMGINADATGIQFRTLNKSKGPAVWATRVQCDKKAYQYRLKAVLERTPNLRLLQATVSGLIVENSVIAGVSTDLGVNIGAGSVVITAGTFLRGLLHVGEHSKPGGRMADTASTLSDSIRALGFEAGRFKTGTPCRINGRSIDFNGLEEQAGDEPPPRFSFIERVPKLRDDVFTLNFDPRGLFHVEQLPCWITHTSAHTHDLIRSNLHRSPLYQRRIEGIGPRYCPSIEDKVVRFSDRKSHQIFLEPEGRHSNEFYVNGVSTSLPFDVQLALIHSVRGLEHAEIVRPGYAVEYDFFPPTQLCSTLETKKISGLFFAGQVNGTSGYEEAAGQGLVAGTNAALRAQCRESLELSPRSSYIGVLIADLTMRGTDEPYRMFTSRAENRLGLREDNADLRLTELGAQIGLVDDARLIRVRDKKGSIGHLKTIAANTVVNGRILEKAMKDPRFTLATVPSDILSVAPTHIWDHVVTDMKYEGYLGRQSSPDSITNRPIPDGFDFAAVPGLRNETRQKLQAIRPTSMANAGRIPGVTAADLSILSMWLNKNGLCQP